MSNEKNLPYAVVCGGVNIDIGAHSFAPLRDRDSNPGRVELSLGGVGRNIAHNMRLLGVPTPFSFMPPARPDIRRWWIPGGEVI